MAVHLDDDVTEVALGNKHDNLFPVGGLQGIVAHADKLMKELYANHHHHYNHQNHHNHGGAF